MNKMDTLIKEFTEEYQIGFGYPVKQEYLEGLQEGFRAGAMKTRQLIGEAISKKLHILQVTREELEQMLDRIFDARV